MASYGDMIRRAISGLSVVVDDDGLLRVTDNGALADHWNKERIAADTAEVLETFVGETATSRTVAAIKAECIRVLQEHLHEDE